jgi:hypothetical protein
MFIINRFSDRIKINIKNFFLNFFTFQAFVAADAIVYSGWRIHDLGQTEVSHARQHRLLHLLRRHRNHTRCLHLSQTRFNFKPITNGSTA